MTSVTPDSSAASLSVSDSDSNKQIVWPNQKEDYDLLDVVGMYMLYIYTYTYIIMYVYVYIYTCGLIVKFLVKRIP